MMTDDANSKRPTTTSENSITEGRTTEWGALPEHADGDLEIGLALFYADELKNFRAIVGRLRHLQDRCDRAMQPEATAHDIGGTLVAVAKAGKGMTNTFLPVAKRVGITTRAYQDLKFALSAAVAPYDKMYKDITETIALRGGMELLAEQYHASRVTRAKRRNSLIA